MNNIANLLFETKALKICPENKPFWYTSGKIGPYFINADYLYGSESDSAELLSFIDKELENENKQDIPKHIFQKADYLCTLSSRSSRNGFRKPKAEINGCCD